MITRAAGVIGDGINVGTLGNIYQVVIHLQMSCYLSSSNGGKK